MEHGRQPLKENEVVVHVPKGSAQHVRVQESDGSNAEIVVQVSKQRKPGALPVLGVIVK